MIRSICEGMCDKWVATHHNNTAGKKQSRMYFLIEKMTQKLKKPLYPRQRQARSAEAMPLLQVGLSAYLKTTRMMAGESV